VARAGARDPDRESDQEVPVATRDRLTITVEDDGQLHCVGEIDQTTAGLLHEALARAAPGDRLVVDLTRVDYLSSAGIAELFDQVDTKPITVRVRSGSAVDKVIRLCGLGIVAKIEEIPSPEPEVPGPRETTWR